MESINIEVFERFPYLKKYAEYTIYTTYEDNENFNNSEKVTVEGKDVSVEFLKRILQDELYYEYANRYFNKEIKEFLVCYIMRGEPEKIIDYKKTEIIKGIEEAILSNKLILKPEEKYRYENLKKSVSFERFLEENNGSYYNIDVEGNKYLIPIEQIISLMQLSEEEFDKLCDNNEIKTINNIPKEYFIYASYNYFKEHNFFEDFMMPSVISDRFNDIKAFQKIDIQAINQHLKTKDSKFKDIQLDINLENAIMAGIPQDASDLEKAVYIYIKMCKTLTYDDEYYAVNQKGVATEKHKDVNYVSTITPSNNKAVCFEFNLIYSKLLDSLGIKFESDYKNMIGELYGLGHANLEFRSGKYLVSADSVTAILQGDMMQAKLNQPLIGLECKNLNENTQQEFKSAVSKMYELIVRQEHQFEEIPKVEYVQTFEELMAEYSKTTTNIKKVGLDEKLSILIEKVNSTKMDGIDSLSYALQLRKTLFSEQERKSNISITVIRNNEPFDSNKIAMPSAIVALNHQNFEENQNQNIYYLFNPNKDLVPILKEELQAKFNNRLFEYVDETKDLKIPGIVDVGGIRK